MPGSSSMVQKAPRFMDFLVNYSNLTNPIWPCKISWWHGAFSQFWLFLGWKKTITQPITHHPKPGVPKHPNPPWWPSPQTPRCHRNPDWPWVSTTNFKDFSLGSTTPWNLTAGYPKKGPIFEKRSGPTFSKASCYLGIHVKILREYLLILAGCYLGGMMKDHLISKVYS